MQPLPYAQYTNKLKNNVSEHKPIIPMYIGTSANGEDASAEITYEYTLRKELDPTYHLEIEWMRQTNNKSSIWGGWQTKHWSTPFSGFRWAIPEACGFKGRAIYTDEDMLSFRTISDLYTIDMGGKPIAARRGTRFGGHEFCVMVIDCEMMKDFLIPVERMKKIPEYHHRMINQFSGNESLVQELDPRWNCLDGEKRTVDDMWILHYTRMNSQPWQPGWFQGKIENHIRPELCELWYKLHDEARAVYLPHVPNEKVVYNIIGQ